MQDIEKLIKQGKYIDASALAIYRGKTYEARSLFSQDKRVTNAKIDAFENLLLADAATDFDCYNRFLDYRQPINRNFYIDRRRYLKPIADAITEMYFPKDPDKPLDVLRIKLRTRSGKSEFLNNRLPFWVQGIHPDGETLACVGGGTLRDNIYEKKIAFIDEYWERHEEVFPGIKVVRESKEYTSIWMRKSEYADISTVTVGGSIEGHVQCTNLLILDDLVSSTEINSAKRLEDIYSSDILNAIMRRYISGKMILIGTPIPTLTGVKEPLDRFYENRKLAGFSCAEFTVPSLNKDMESNYAYRTFDRKGNYQWNFTTREMLNERRAAYESGNDIEIATFETIFQMRPMEQGNRRFSKIKRYGEVFDNKYREITMFDTADSGTDAAVCLHGRIYNGNPDIVYIHDIFYDKRPMDLKENGGYLEDLVDFFIENDIHSFKYESNLGGTILGETLVRIAKEKGWMFTYTTYSQQKNKIQRILDNAMQLIKTLRFREVPPTKSYDTAVKELMDWSENAKHDDVADCATKLVEEHWDKNIKENEYSFISIF